MRIECFTKREWLKIAESISKYCPSEPLLEKLVGQIHDKIANAMEENGKS